MIIQIVKFGIHKLKTLKFFKDCSGITIDNLIYKVAIFPDGQLLIGGVER